MAILRIPVTKAGNKAIEVNTDTDIPDAMYQLALEEGLKVLLNKGMSKISTKGLEGEALDEVAEARHRGQNVFGETCPQYLHLTLEGTLDRPGFEGAKFVRSPPLRCSQGTGTRAGPS